MTTASDIYSLGKLLLELLAGDTLSADLEQIVERATRREPSERYRSARELADDIGKVIREEPVLLQSGPQAAAQRRRPWAMVAVVVAAAVSLAGFAAVGLAPAGFIGALESRHPIALYPCP